MKRTMYVKSTFVIYEGYFVCVGGTTAILGNLHRCSMELTYVMSEFGLEEPGSVLKEQRGTREVRE